MEALSFGELEAATEAFAVETLIGKGSHGHVHRATLKSGKQVAVKKPAPWLLHRSTGSETSKLQNEAEILASIQSPHIVSIKATSTTGIHLILIMELMPNGSLHDLLHLSAVPPTWRRRVVVAHQIAQALQTLHEAAPPIIHRDVKSSNVLLDSNGDAKLADFSLAVRYHHYKKLAPAGTIGYMDPCYNGPAELSVSNDIFSFGVLLLELISGRAVMDTMSETTSIVAWATPFVDTGLVSELCDPRVPLACKTERVVIAPIISMAARCLCLQVERRPSAGEIVSKLRTILEQLDDRRRPLWDNIELRRRIGKCVRVLKMKRRNRVSTGAKHKTIICDDHLVKSSVRHGLII